MNQSEEFEGGITNGAAWYPLWGGMQDWQSSADALQFNHRGGRSQVAGRARASAHRRRTRAIKHDDVRSNALRICERIRARSATKGHCGTRGGGPGGDAAVTTDGLGFFSKPSAPSGLPTRITVTPPTRPWVRYQPSRPPLTPSIPSMAPVAGRSSFVPYPFTAVRLHPDRRRHHLPSSGDRRAQDARPSPKTTRFLFRVFADNGTSGKAIANRP